MAVTVRRQAGGGRSTFTQGLQRSDSIVYNVDGLDVRTLKTLIAGGVGVEGLPNYGQAHPELPVELGLVARAFNVSESETGLNADVEVVFATSNVSGSGLLYAVPDLDGGQFVLSATFETAEVTIPYCVKDTYTVNANGQQVTKEFWRVTEKRINEPRVVLQARWQLQGSLLTLPIIQAFEDQHGKIHQLGGKRYVFTAGSIMPRDNFTYEVTASWTGDNGTPTVDTTEPNKYAMPWDMGFVTGTSPAEKWPNTLDLMRSPFHVIDTVPSEDPDDIFVTPLCLQVQKYAESLNGYQTLPGNPFT